MWAKYRETDLKSQWFEWIGSTKPGISVKYKTKFNKRKIRVKSYLGNKWTDELMIR